MQVGDYIRVWWRERHSEQSTVARICKVRKVTVQVITDKGKIQDVDKSGAEQNLITWEHDHPEIELPS